MYVILSCFNQNWILSTNFTQITNTKFHENPSGWSDGFSCGLTDGWLKSHDETSSSVSKMISECV
jgi:hypothetical protein